MNQIENDPPVDEVREVRHQISARFHHDPDELIAYYLKFQEQYKDRLVDAKRNKDADQHAA